MKSFVTGGATLLLALGLAACAGPRAFTQGVYGDPGDIQMLEDKWNQNDMQLVAKKVVNSLDMVKVQKNK